MSSQTRGIVRLANYRRRRGGDRLLDCTKIWEAGRATSAATSFFDPITIGRFGETFVDSTLRANNPVHEVWNEAQDVWKSETFEDNVQCLVSIGTGVPSLRPFKDDLLSIGKTLVEIATETQMTAEQFSRDKSGLDGTGRHYRFNVSEGLENIGLEESNQKHMIMAATDRYIESQAVFRQMQACAKSLRGTSYN